MIKIMFFYACLLRDKSKSTQVPNRPNQNLLNQIQKPLIDRG